MSVIKLITTVSLTVVLITMITSNQLTIYASPTTEDDGWTEDDYEGSSEEQEEQAQDDWEDAGRPGETEDDDDNENDDDNNDNDNGLFECEDGSLVETEELCEQSEVLITCSDGSSAGNTSRMSTRTSINFYYMLRRVICGNTSRMSTSTVPTFITCSDGSSATQAECPPVPTAHEQFKHVKMDLLYQLTKHVRN